MDISLFFQPLEINTDNYLPNSFGQTVTFHTTQAGFPALKGMHIAIIGVKEDRKSINNNGCAGAIGKVREYLYRLFQGDDALKIADLGNIAQGADINDTYFALSSTVSELLKKRVIPIIIGGGQDLTYATYLAYMKLEQTVNLTVVDNNFNLGKADDELHSESFLSKIILHQPNFLFNYSSIAYQSYFVDKYALELMSKLHFDYYRLGEVQAAISEVEPVVRDADMLSFDVSAIRGSDAPGNANATPNGLFGQEACQIMRYAGMSDKLSSLGIYEYNPEYDNRGQTAHLLAQMIWYFIDGYYNRKNEFPIRQKKNYLRYRVTLQDGKHEVVFFKSRKSDRWWMEVPYPPNKGIKFERQLMVPCSYNDYRMACNDEIPAKWWKVYQKLL